MSWLQSVLLLAVGAPWLAAACFFLLGEHRERVRAIVGFVAGAVATAASVAVGVGVASGAGDVSVRVPLLGVGFGLRADALGVLFAVVASGLWLVTTVYAIGYLSHGRDKARFFGFFAICVGSAIGIAFSSNLLTLFVFYEALTLATYPLVVHTGTSKAVKGGRTYLAYALTGGTLLAVGIVWLYALGGLGDFASGGSLPVGLADTHAPQLVAVFALLVAGFGVKAALFPAHGWLPAAMVAPAPVSALLHAVAVVKAGVFGLARVVLDVFGVETAAGIGVLAPLAGLAAFTLLFASVRALAQDDIKRRLAYSTIGQLSYIVLGLALGTPLAVAAALAHLAHHAVLKITMFFTAGVLAEELKVYRVSQMDGVGRRMPLAMTAFSVAALGIIGVPPIAGFITKWGLGAGALAAGQAWPLAVLALSSLLNAAYLMPMIGRAWFGAARPEWAEATKPRSFEGDVRMVVPLVLTAIVGLVIGPLAGAGWAPAAWAARITGADASRLIPWSPHGLGLDDAGMLYLVLGAIVWGAAAVSSWGAPGAERTRYRTFFLLAAGGSMALALAIEPGAFYACFSVMALSAYGLIVHDGSTSALKAGRAYLSFTVVGEAFLLAGLLFGSAGEGGFAESLLASPWAVIGTALLLLAFGIKIGAAGLGGWMPGAYSAAPAGAGAAIAGVVSSAGVLGLIRFMPGGVIDLPGWGSTVMTLGVITAFGAAILGCLQRDPKHVLAYSSMSQFGLMSAGIGAGLTAVEVWPVAVAAVGVYLVHHGFAKAALFAGEDALGAGAGGRATRAGLLLPALALAGLPFTSGAVAKVALKGAVAEVPGAWHTALETLLPIAAIGTTLLMGRFIFMSARATGARRVSTPSVKRRRTMAFAVLVAFVAAFLWISGYEPAAYAAGKSLTMPYLWVLTWPVVVGAILAALAWRFSGRLSVPDVKVRPGDMSADLLDRADAAWLAYQQRLTVAVATDDGPVLISARVTDTGSRLLALALAAESRMLTWPLAASAIVALALLVLALAR